VSCTWTAPSAKQSCCRPSARVKPHRARKKAGIIVDYYGVARHLKEPCRLLSRGHRRRAAKLPGRDSQAPRPHERCLELFKSRGCDVKDQEACIYLLEDEKLRAEFTVKLKLFSREAGPGAAAPRSAAVLPVGQDLATFSAGNKSSTAMGQRAAGREIGNKLRKLIDDHIVSLGIDPKIAPIAITDATFSEQVDKKVSPRAKASEMEHAARHHIKKHMDQDPSIPAPVRAAGRDPEKVRRKLGAASHRAERFRRGATEDASR